MSSPYRESTASSIQCPRCGTETASGDIVACIDGCGVWVASEAAQDAFDAGELQPSRITSWFRERCGCPLCGTQMTLRGLDMALFLGCDAHGFWVDDSTVTQTGLGRSAMAGRLGEARAQAKARKAELARAAAEERDRKRAEEDDRARRGITLAEEQARKREDARKAEQARQRAQREARRQQLAERIRIALTKDDVLPIVDELIRLEDAIAALANRVTSGGL